ncbi:MAG TPA: serine/threonine-protein kinase, partial [Ktedonobacteraceae bacterium]
HEHILPLFEFGEVQGKLFLVTPYISGGTLAQRLHAGSLSLTEVQQLFTALVQAVIYIHRRGIIHRDLKPTNILLDNEEETGQVYVRLIDFGIATKQGAEASPPLTTAGHEIGTRAFMAPERLDGIAAPGNDIYSLGVILCQMLTGHLPESEIPAPFEAVIRRCLEINPADRYASATAVLHAFEQACYVLHASAAPASQSMVLPPAEIIPFQPVYEQGTIEARTLQDTGDISTPQKDRVFGDADYVAPTVDIALEHVGIGRVMKSKEKQGHAASIVDIPASVPGRKRGADRGRRHKKPLFLIVPLLIVVLLFVMGGLIFFEFPLLASASVNIGPRTHVLQQVFTITAQPSQTSIDVATASIPAHETVNTLSGSQSQQTTGQRCTQFFFQCRQVVTPADVENLSLQVSQSLISQLSTQIDNQLQALHATAIGQKQYVNLSQMSNPDIGAVSNTVDVTLTEQGSVEYINTADLQQLAHELLAQRLVAYTMLINSTIQVSQPVIEAVTDSGMVTMKVAASGLEEYHYPSSQLQAILNHIKGMSLADARTYLRQQAGVDANSVSISIHSAFGNSDTLPYSASQIMISYINPTSLPSAPLPTLPTPAVSPDNLTPTV